MSLSFEASFSKAMRLLHSPSKDAIEQLKTMLDESSAQKKVPAIMQTKQSIPTVMPVISTRTPVTTPAPAPAPIIAPSEDIDCISCVVCKRVDQSTGNEIVECQECHSLYHQECHKPSLANENVKDPRFVWYCTTCTSKRKKAKLPGKPSVSSSSNNSSSKEVKESQNPENSPFKSWSFLKK